MGRLIFTVLLSLTPFAAEAAETARPVFIKTTCDGKITSTVLSKLRDEISASPRYRLVHNLTDEGQMDVVLSIYMNCTERSDVAAIAFAFGQAKCFSSTNCHLAVDGSTIKPALCELNAAAECGRALFKAFDDYMSNPIRAPLRLD